MTNENSPAPANPDRVFITLEDGRRTLSPESAAALGGVSIRSEEFGTAVIRFIDTESQSALIEQSDGTNTMVTLESVLEADIIN